MNRKRGFADIAVVGLVAVAAVLSILWFRGRDTDGIRADARYRGQVREAVATVEAMGPYRFKNLNIRLTTPKAEKVVGGLPVFWVASEQRYVGGHWTGGGRIAVARDANGNIHNGALIHELWHVLLGQHGIPMEDHHRIMRQYGVYGA